MILFFDTETTGLPLRGQYDNPRHPQTPRLVELGALLFTDEGSCIEKLEHIVKPNGFEIPKAASDVHGITTERALTEGIPLKLVMPEFEDLQLHADRLVAHNIQYDWLILRRAYMDVDSFIFSSIERFCTKEAYTPICRIPGFRRGEFKWPTLMEAHKFVFNEEFSGAHGALADVYACARLYFKLKDINLPRFEEASL